MRPSYLTVKQCAARFAVSVPTVWRWVQEGHYPRPIKLGPACTRWRLEDIEAFENKCAEESLIECDAETRG